MDVARIEAAEAGLDSFIAGRDKQRRKDEGERPPEEIWAASCRAYTAKREEQRWWDRLHAAEDRIRAHTATFSVLIAHHEREASRCRMALGLEDNEERKSA